MAPGIPEAEVWECVVSRTLADIVVAPAEVVAVEETPEFVGPPSEHTLSFQLE